MACDDQNLVMGLVQEATYIETENKAYMEYQKFIIEKYKINATYVLFPAEEIISLKENDEIPRGIDVLIFSVMMNLMKDRIGNNFKAFSFPMRFNPLLILSSPPKSQSATTMDFLRVDFYTSLCLSLCLILVSAFWTIHQFLEKPRTNRNKAQTARRLILNSLESLWIKVKIFFFEPYTFIPNGQSIRVATGVWLLGVLILNINVTSVMRSTFSFVTYNLVDNLKDLRNQKALVPKMLKGGIEERLVNLKSIDNEDFRYVKDLISEETYLSREDLFAPDLYTTLKEGEYLFINYHILLLLTGFLLKDDHRDNSIYVSNAISEDYMAYPYSFNSCRCHKVARIFDQVIMNIFETKWIKPVYFEDRNLLSTLQWRIPSSEIKAIAMGDFVSVTYLFLIGLLLSSFCITMELFKLLLTKKRQRKNW